MTENAATALTQIKFARRVLGGFLLSSIENGAGADGGSEACICLAKVRHHPEPADARPLAGRRSLRLSQYIEDLMKWRLFVHESYHKGRIAETRAREARVTKSPEPKKSEAMTLTERSTISLIRRA